MHFSLVEIEYAFQGSFWQNFKERASSVTSDSLAVY